MDSHSYEVKLRVCILIQSWDRETELPGNAMNFQTSKPTPSCDTASVTRHTFQSFSNSSTDWEPSIHIYESLEDTLIHTSTGNAFPTIRVIFVGFAKWTNDSFPSSTFFWTHCFPELHSLSCRPAHQVSAHEVSFLHFHSYRYQK